MTITSRHRTAPTHTLGGDLVRSLRFVPSPWVKPSDDPSYTVTWERWIQAERLRDGATVTAPVGHYVRRSQADVLAAWERFALSQGETPGAASAFGAWAFRTFWDGAEPATSGTEHSVYAIWHAEYHGSPAPHALWEALGDGLRPVPSWEEATAIARAIALAWHDGQASALYGFGSTGDLSAWGRALAQLDTFAPGTPVSERRALAVLRAYGERAAQDGLCGPALYVVVTRYTVPVDGDGDPDWSDTDAQGRPIPNRTDILLPEPDAQEGETIVSAALAELEPLGLLYGEGGAWLDSEPQTIDYATGELEQVSVWPVGFTDTDHAFVMNGQDDRTEATR